MRTILLRRKNAAGLYRLIPQTYNCAMLLVFAPLPDNGHNGRQGKDKKRERGSRVGRWSNLWGTFRDCFGFRWKSSIAMTVLTAALPDGFE